MMVVTTIGYIVSVLGPYQANSKNNDASILKHMIYHNADETQKLALRGGCVCSGPYGLWRCWDKFKNASIHQTCWQAALDFNLLKEVTKIL